VINSVVCSVKMSSSSSSLPPHKQHPVGCCCSTCPDYVVLQRPAVPHSSVKTMLRAAAMKSKGGKSFRGLKPIRAKLYSGPQASTSTAGAANSFVSPVSFNSSTFTEIADFATVYDECRILGVKLHYYPVITTAGATATASAAVAVSYDPSASAPGGVAGVLEETFSAGPFRLHAGINGATIQSGSMLQPYHKLMSHPPVELAPITSSDCPGKAWFCVDGNTAPIVAVIGAFIDSLGTGGVSVLYYYVELDAEFRLRT